MKAKLKRLVINPQAFFSIMQNETAWRVHKGIPKTAKLRGFLLDPMTQNMILFVEDDSFESIEVEKTVAPILETEFRRIV